MRCHSRHRTCPENLCINANHRNLAIFGLATSREKRVSKNKDMYGVACKPIHKSRDRRDSGSYPPTQFPIRSGLANFLFFQIFVSLVILTMPTPLWADLISLTVDSGGDNVFRGEVDRLRIIFTVDDSDDGGSVYR